MCFRCETVMFPMMFLVISMFLALIGLLGARGGGRCRCCEVIQRTGGNKLPSRRSHVEWPGHFAGELAIFAVTPIVLVRKHPTSRIRSNAAGGAPHSSGSLNSRLSKEGRPGGRNSSWQCLASSTSP